MSKKRPIKAEELGKFTIDNSNKLYWEDKPIKSENVVLSFWQKSFAFIIGFSAILASFTSVNKEFCLIDLGKTCVIEDKQSGNSGNTGNQNNP